MDDIVIRALAKWPNVPHCFGWLGLDARGQWFMRDDQTQRAGAFASGIRAAKGSLLMHDKLIEFIARNYAADALGQWFFQNGPQRVYVELAATPYIWRINDEHQVSAHTGHVSAVQHCLLDELGHVYLQCELGFGLVHSQDVARAADALEIGLWTAQTVASADLPRRFAFVKSPQETSSTLPVLRR